MTTATTIPAPGLLLPARVTHRTAKVAITNQKGGVGKTSLALGVAAVAAAAGWNVLLLDADPQESSYKTTQAFTGEAGYHVAADTDPAHLAKLDLNMVAGGEPVTLLVIDCPGSLEDTGALAHIIGNSDLIIVPYEHDPLSLPPTLNTVRYVQAHGGNPRVLINNIDGRYPVIEADARSLLASIRLTEYARQGVPHFQAAVRSYKVWSHSLRDGIPITEYPGEYAARAREDITAVFREMAGLVTKGAR